MSVVLSVGGEETGKDHDEIGYDDDDDVGAAQAGQQGKVEQKQRCRKTPVDVAGPVDLAIDVANLVGAVVVRLTADAQRVGEAVAGRHGKVRHRREEDDKGGDDVEQPFLLRQA